MFPDALPDPGERHGLVGALILQVDDVREGIDAVVVMWDVNSDDFTMVDIEFPEAAAAQAVSFVDLDGGGANACDNFKMYNCKAIQNPLCSSI